MNQDRPAGYPPPETYPPQYPPTQGYPQSGFPQPGFYGITPAPQPPPKKPRRVLTIVASVFVTLVLVLIALAVIGSAMTPTSSGPAPSRPVPTQQAPQAAPVVPAPTQAPTTQAPTTVPDTSSSYDSTQFGRPAVLSNGVQVQVSAPQGFTPSGTAAGNSGVRAFVTEITVRNGTAQPLNPSMISASASVNGQEAGSVYDSAQDIGLPTTNVLPGRSVTYRAVFSSPVEHGAVQVDVSPGFSNGTASFTGSDL